MGDLFERGNSMLRKRRTAALTQTVDYHAKSGPLVVGLKATFGRTDYEDENGLVEVGYKSKDFILNVDDLGFEPQEGDRIQALDTTWEVQPIRVASGPSPDDPAWTYADDFRTTYRIHTKEIES